MKKVKKSAFTIIELLTVMSIIVILIGLLVPALNMVKRFALDVKQAAQLHSMDTALELFNSTFDGYPESISVDQLGNSYCGSMRVSEAMLGQDMLGFHKDSVFRMDGRDTNGIYPLYGLSVASPAYDANLNMRKGPYLPLDNANVFRLRDIYSTGDIGSSQFSPDSRVLCDIYSKNLPTGVKAGMPILYYKANTVNNLHDPNLASIMGPRDNAKNIYNYLDNHELVKMGIPTIAAGSLDKSHEMENVNVFYSETRSEKVTTTSMPCRPDTYILIAAGFDGEYGTEDDICNYNK